jgi:hypothetical protein
MATKDLLKFVLRDPRSLLRAGGFSPTLGTSRFEGVVGRHYRVALHDCDRTLKWLMWDVARRLGPGRVAAIVRGTDEFSEAELGYVLLSAERLTQMLAHLHIGRLLAQQAERWPERQVLAERFMRRASDVCALNARRIMRGDRDALEAIEQWHADATA